MNINPIPEGEYMRSSSEVYLNILLNDYAEARDDERNFLSVQATSLTLGVTAAAGLLVFFEQVIDRSKDRTEQFPDLVIAGALMAGFVTIAFALWVGSVATVRAFYLRSLEREIRRVAKLENVSFGDLGLRPISFHELVVEHGSLSKPVSTTTSILVNIVVIGLITVFGVIGSFLAFQINGRWMIPIVFFVNGVFVLYALWELWQISVGGRKYVRELTQRYKERLGRDLVKRYSRSSPWPVISYALLPRPDDLVKSLFTIGGLIISGLTIEGTSSVNLRCKIVIFVAIELLAYQARYQINDLLGRSEDKKSPTAGYRGRLPEGAEKHSVFSILVRIVLIISAVVYLFDMDNQGAVHGTWFRLLLTTLFVFVLMVPYEIVRNWVRVDPDASSKKRRSVTWVLLFLVALGYPLRFAGSAFCLTDTFSLGLWAPLVIMRFGLGWVFVAPTWVLESFNYVSGRSKDGRSYRVIDECKRKYHLKELAAINGWSMLFESSLEASSVEWDDLDGTSYRALKARVPSGVKLWSIGSAVYYFGLSCFVLFSGLFNMTLIGGTMTALILCVMMSFIALVGYDDRRVVGPIASAVAIGLIFIWPAHLHGVVSWMVVAFGLILPVGLVFLFSGPSYMETRGVMKKAWKMCADFVPWLCEFIWKGRRPLTSSSSRD